MPNVSIDHPAAGTEQSPTPIPTTFKVLVSWDADVAALAARADGLTDPTYLVQVTLNEVVSIEHRDLPAAGSCCFLFENQGTGPAALMASLHPVEEGGVVGDALDTGEVDNLEIQEELPAEECPDPPCSGAV